MSLNENTSLCTRIQAVQFSAAPLGIHHWRNSKCNDLWERWWQVFWDWQSL